METTKPTKIPKEGLSTLLQSIEAVVVEELTKLANIALYEAIEATSQGFKTLGHALGNRQDAYKTAILTVKKAFRQSKARERFEKRTRALEMVKYHLREWMRDVGKRGRKARQAEAEADQLEEPEQSKQTFFAWGRQFEAGMFLIEAQISRDFINAELEDL